MSTHGTVLFYSPEHRLAVIGWESGDVRSMVISEHMRADEISSLLSVYDRPIPVKYGREVRVLLPSTSDLGGDTAEAVFETIPLNEYAYLMPGGDRITFLCGMSPTTKRWYVRV